ncbi:MAG: SDR family oxidoreductase [Alphaproteobacteria bacterium]|nr:SDR family oxidoreductase [Alphaproteobacteria bacterium]
MLNKIIFITGATSGFGKATAEKCASAGAKLILLGRRAERLQSLKKQLNGTAIHLIACDVRDREALFREVAALPPEFADIDVLVNNAGLALGLEKAHEARLEEWDEMIDTNVKALVALTRAVLPGMVARDRGHVVNIGSIAGSYPYPGGNVYGATKAFVEQFSLNLRADLLGTNVRVTNIEPGLSAETEFSLVRFRNDAEKAKKVYEGTQPLTAEDIADAILWAITRPAHVNINRIELMPTCQASGPLAVARKERP